MEEATEKVVDPVGVETGSAEVEEVEEDTENVADREEEEAGTLLVAEMAI